MTDLITFCNRTDLPALAQAALAHAQFESIHPFTDSNGRIGRATSSTSSATWEHASPDAHAERQP